MALRSFSSRHGAAALALGLLPGCSWLLVQRPPGGPPGSLPPGECTSSVAAPVADTVGAVAFGATGASLLYAGASAPASDWVPARPILVGVGLVGAGVAALLGASAGHGYSATAECREREERLRRERDLPATRGVSPAARAGSP